MAGSFNHITLVGRLVRDPASRQISEEVGLASFVLAVDRPYGKNSKKGETADFIPVVAWRKLGKICQDLLTKGRLILVEGRLELSSYEKEGVRHQRAEVVASNVQLLDFRKKETEQV